MRLATFGFPAVSLFAVSLFLSGCATSFVSDVAAPVISPAPGAPSQGAFGTINGVLHGGQQAITGAHIYAYAASTSAYSGAATSLLTSTGTANFPTKKDANNNYYVTTDAQGGFTLAASTLCTVGTQVYLYSLGGNPGQVAGTNNTATTLMAALGLCPAAGLLEDTVGTDTRIVMNEGSTIALAYAASGFATDGLHIGAPTGTPVVTTVAGVTTITYPDELAGVGLGNAFANANQLYSLPYGSTTTRSVTPNGNGTVPQTTLNALANILASCVNTLNSVAPACSNTAAIKGLFYYATSTGTAGGGTEPTDTATAAINIAHHPGSNVAALFKLASSTIDPFFPALAAAPHDFGITIGFSGGGLVKTGLFIAPHGIAVDAKGNIWTTNSSSTVLSAFTPLGVPLAGSPFSNSLNAPANATVDTAGNVWVANINGPSLAEFSSTGAVVPFSSSALGLTAPYDVQFDASGNLWVPDEGASTVDKATTAGALLKSTATTGESPVAIEIQSGATGEVFVEDFIHKRFDIFTSADVSAAAYKGLGDPSVGGAMDSTNNALVVETTEYFFYGNATAATQYQVTTGAYYTPNFGAAAVDGADIFWVTDYANGAVLELTNANTELSPTYGYLPPGNALPTSANASNNQPVAPNSVAVDGSGNVWYNGIRDADLHEIIGIATPVVTPIAYGTANAKLGTKP